MRPQTYENAEESKLLLSVFRGRNGLQNTVFALLDPDGEPLTRGSRSPMMTYGSVERFVAALRGVSADYAEKAGPIRALPVLADLRVALNVAAADLRPLVVVCGDGSDAAEELSRKVAEVAWSAEAIGRFHYVVLTEQTTFEGLGITHGVSVVQAESYGRGGEAIASADPDASTRGLGPRAPRRARGSRCR